MRVKSKSFSAVAPANSNPGPGNYNSSVDTGTAQQYSFGSPTNNKFVTTMVTPGPGAYSNMPIQRKPVTTKIGLENKDYSNKHIFRSHYNHVSNPGPGN